MTTIDTPADVAARNVATVHRFLRLLEEKDIAGWIDLWAEGADHYYPYGTEMFPAHLVGKAAIHDHWKDLPAQFTSLSFPVHETWVDGDTVIARFDSHNEMAAGGTYANTYVCIYKFDAAGKIREYWEYFDPIIAGVDYGLAEIAYRPGVGATPPSSD
jgi:ketosteroid isomerase-like protein